jgi:uncharacterized protein YdhG (YjbR/CyaY superfamily)
MKSKIKTSPMHLLLILFLGFSQIALAQKPEKIESLTKVQKSTDYYAQQVALWKKELDQNKKNAEAWFNYYRANRYVAISSNTDTLKNEKRWEQLKGIIDEMEKNIPESFEFNYLTWLNSGNDLSKFSYLEKAYAISPERTETYPDFVAAYELKQDQEKKDFFLKKWHDAGQISPGYLTYNYNVLNSLAPNAILLTIGDNDTYPVWILQSVFGIRKDVQLINLSMLYLENYHKAMSEKIGFEPIYAMQSQEKFNAFNESIIKNIAANKAGRKTYTGLTVHPTFTQKHEANLYLVGLAYEYSEKKFDNIAVLKKNFEQVFALDYLHLNFAKDPAESSLKMSHGNYLVPMITLYEHYQLSNDTDKAERLKNQIVAIAQTCGQEETIKEYLK